MSNAWFRLYAEFATDPKIQMLSESLQRRFIMLLCIRCNGSVTLHDDEVTFQMRVTPEEWQETKAIFIAKGFIDKANNIIHWDKRQFRSDSSKERVARHREKLKQPCNVTVTPPDTDTDTEKKESKGRGTRFEKTEPPADWILFLQKQRPDLNFGDIFDQFCDYWKAQPGQRGVKLDWDATWRNWVRRQQKGNQNGQQFTKAERARAAVLRGLGDIG